MSISEKDYSAIAARHGVDLAKVKPVPKAERIKRLTEILARTDVPFVIDPAKASKCLADYVADQPFGVGSFGKSKVDLGEYSAFQIYENYTHEEHLSWACLVADQQHTKHQFACREYLSGEAMFEIGDCVIPDFYLLNARIYQQTEWQLSTVSMIIPAELFFTCHSLKFFPVTTFMRELEQDYLQEPDIGHDVAGHVATFTIPSVTKVMVNHGLARDLIYEERNARIADAGDDSTKIDEIKSWADELLLYAGRIYWFTVEFGLVMQDGEVRDFGAGILSSPGETIYSIDSPESNRVLIDPSCDHDLLRLATTDYLISEYQKTYFVMNSFDLLESLSPERILSTAKKSMELPHYTWREVVPGDDTINVGSVVTSPNEKYYRLLTNQPLDECLTRAAIRNLRMYANGFDMSLLNQFKALPPEIPQEIIEWFRKEDVGDRFKIETEDSAS